MAHLAKLTISLQTAVLLALLGAGCGTSSGGSPVDAGDGLGADVAADAAVAGGEVAGSDVEPTDAGPGDAGATDVEPTTDAIPVADSSPQDVAILDAPEPDAPTSPCDDGDLLACDGETCKSAGRLGDGSCDDFFDCEANGFDGGDCEPGPACGDGQCDEDEDPGTCPQDCDPTADCGDGVCEGFEFVTCPEDCETGPECGDGECNGDEDSQSCPDDCPVEPVCGDGQCDGVELFTCPDDCDPQQYCGDGECSQNETPNSCPEDCGGNGPECGDGLCEGPEPFTCPMDCEAGPTCGDGVCSANESPQSCPEDCDDNPPECGDGVCEGIEFIACPEDCEPGPECGDGVCQSNENAQSCPADCDDGGPECGDGVCEGIELLLCPEDCEGGPECGDGVCQSNETALSCPVDCDDGGPECGDGVCEGIEPFLCPEDCEAGPTCGDGVCEDGEGPQSCPQDCANNTCNDGQVVNCIGTCTLASWVGDNICDEVLNCAQHGFDGGDCGIACGDGICSPGEGNSCPEDCLLPPVCGDGLCEDGENPDNCIQDCPPCPAGQLLDCDLGCTPANWVGDNICDPTLNCAEFGFDGGDCGIACGDGICSQGEGNSCPEDCLLPPVCGDGVCEDGENPDNCIQDCPPCPGGQILDCNGGCTPANWVGDNICDQMLNCAEFGFDGGDCGPVCGDGVCSQGEGNSCPEDCFLPPVCGDGVCEDGENPDNCIDDCPPCPSGQILNCNGGCTSGSWLGDGICDQQLNCADFNFDGGDCGPVCGDGVCSPGEGNSCPKDCLVPPVCGNGACEDGETPDSCPADCSLCDSDEVVDCDGGCMPASWVGDQFCDPELNCAEFDFDGGDCGPACGDGVCSPGEGNSCPKDCLVPPVCGNGACEDGETPDSCPADCSLCDSDEVVDCDGGCMPASWVGDQFCDPELNCAEFDFDGGDCGPACGDGVCSPGEGNTCPEDCLVPPVCGNGACEDGETPDSCPADCSLCGSNEVVDCDGGCMPADWVGDQFCDPELNCAEFDFDGGDCGPACGDGVCSPGEANSCPDDCFVPPVCGNGACEDGETPDSCPADCSLCGSNEVVDCDGGCMPADWVGDQFCDPELNCAEFDFDGGDCGPACGDGVCSPGEGNTCPEDCLVPPVCGNGACEDGESSDSCFEDCPACPSGQMLNCNGGCTSASWLGDNICDPVLNCAEFAFDEGDCGVVCGDGICSEDEPDVCPEDCQEPIVCGDGVCEDGEDSDNCIQDCPPCDDGQVFNCNGGCTVASWVGDGICDQMLNCAEFAFDEGDCGIVCGDGICSQGETPTCPEDCSEPPVCGDGLCEDGEDTANCLEDCPPCPAGQITDCDGGCTLASWVGDNICDNTLNCAEFSWDDGDCSPDCTLGELVSCDNTCVSFTAIGDGVCDEALNCEGIEFDGGDCLDDPENPLLQCLDAGCPDELAACQAELSCAAALPCLSECVADGNQQCTFICMPTPENQNLFDLGVCGFDAGCAAPQP